MVLHGSSTLKWDQTQICRPSGYGDYLLFVLYIWVMSYRSEFLNRGVPFRHRARVYEACIRPVLLYGSETWRLTVGLIAGDDQDNRQEDVEVTRYMAGVRWQDRVATKWGGAEVMWVMWPGRHRWLRASWGGTDWNGLAMWRERERIAPWGERWGWRY